MLKVKRNKTPKIKILNRRLNLINRLNLKFKPNKIRQSKISIETDPQCDGLPFA